jgi:hypothetical protein
MEFARMLEADEWEQDQGVSFPPYSPPSTKILERQSKNGQEKSHL